MNSNRLIGCINCQILGDRSTLGKYEFQTLLGEKFDAYFCQSCFTSFQKEINKVSPAQQIHCLQNLSKIILGKAIYKTVE